MLTIKMTFQVRRQQMKIFRSIMDFLAEGSNSMRLDAVKTRVRKEIGDLQYKTIADSKREMRDDMMRLRGDFHTAINEASEKCQEEQSKIN